MLAWMGLCVRRAHDCMLTRHLSVMCVPWCSRQWRCITAAAEPTLLWLLWLLSLELPLWAMSPFCSPWHGRGTTALWTGATANPATRHSLLAVAAHAIQCGLRCCALQSATWPLPRRRRAAITAYRRDATQAPSYLLVPFGRQLAPLWHLQQQCGRCPVPMTRRAALVHPKYCHLPSPCRAGGQALAVTASAPQTLLRQLLRH